MEGGGNNTPFSATAAPCTAACLLFPLYYSLISNHHAVDLCRPSIVLLESRSCAVCSVLIEVTLFSLYGRSWMKDALLAYILELILHNR
jgi:hypothetical protein